MYASSTTFNFCLTSRFFQGATETKHGTIKNAGVENAAQIAGMENVAV